MRSTQVTLSSVTVFAQHKSRTVVGAGRDWALSLLLPITPVWKMRPRACGLQEMGASPRSPSNEQAEQTRSTQPRPGGPHRACRLFSPRPGHLADSSRGPPAKDPAQASAGLTADSTGLSGKAVQTQQPCSVRASLSSDICSGLASDGGGARGQGDFQLACLRACASHVGPQWCPQEHARIV